MTVFESMPLEPSRLQMTRTNPEHVVGRYAPIPAGEEGTTFRDALIGSLEEVNGAQVAHEQLSVQAVLDPESVEAHDLTIAAAKANVALGITRNVVDRVIQAYRDITNLR